MTDADDITELDRATVERIAAGEVVERPASVVKELVENSVDADASRVDVTVEVGGTERIVVSDDGVGMTSEGVRKAVRQHTTSKIRDIDDLEAGVSTLGFRGEALHTIGAVSRMTVRTKPRAVEGADADEGRAESPAGADAGTELRMEGGEVTAVESAGCPEGTTVEVTDLFYNVPARRKYLKQERTEFAHVNAIATRYALVNPDVAVSLTHDGREVFATTGRGNLQEALLSVYGREVATAMIEVTDDHAPEGPLDGVGGYVSHPETTRSSREYLSTFVNGRYVATSPAREAVVDAYGNQLAPDRYPFAVLFLDVPPDEVDVNVHPRKMDVRFAREAGVRNQVETAVENALLDHGLLRSSAPRGRSQAEEADVEPARQADLGAAERAAEEAAEGTGDGGGGTASDAESGAGAASGRRDDSAGERPATSRNRADSSSSGDGVDSSPSGDGVDSPSSEDGVDSFPSADRADSSSSGDRADARVDEPEGVDAGVGASAGERTGEDDPDSRSRYRRFGGTDQTTLEGDRTGEPATFENLPELRVLGQFRDTYVVAESPEGLVLIDQHAADERVNYERLTERFEGETATQTLAEPVDLELTAAEAAVFEEYREALARLGFRAGLVDDRTVEVTTVPAVVGEALSPDLVRDVLSRFVSTDDERAAGTVEAAADALLADLACYPSVTGNTSLTEGSVVDLLAALDDCENPYACPHGRPTVVAIDQGEIESRFERDYPGHGGRRRP